MIKKSTNEMNSFLIIIKLILFHPKFSNTITTLSDLN